MKHHEPYPRRSAFQGLLKILNISTSPTLLANGEEEAIGDVDEPPDNLLSEVQAKIPEHGPDRGFVKSPIMFDRKESLLTKALMNTEDHEKAPNPRRYPHSLGLSTGRTYSNTSTASTAELSSDDTNSPARTESPSPPLPPQYNKLPTPQNMKLHDTPITKVPLTPVEEAPEAVVEANLGRKRCITFACGRKPAQKPVEQAPKVEAPAPAPAPAAEPTKRKITLKFACPSRQSSTDDAACLDPSKRPDAKRQVSAARASTPPPSTTATTPKATPITIHKRESSSDMTPRKPTTAANVKSDSSETSEALRFHEFASSAGEEDAWVNEAVEHKPKILMDDFLKKEKVIRQIGAEVEEEAEEEEEEADELEEEYDDIDQEDDFAPSDADDGNESDNEEGFAESDDESDDGSEDAFWAPSIATAATSTEHLEHIRPLSYRRGSASSVESTDCGNASMAHPTPMRYPNRRHGSKMIKMRPGTPDLPDSTDFVCGTLDEDRPLEAAYISCMEQRKRAKLVPIPQDIDPSFPTTDPEDEDDEEDDYQENDDKEPQWWKGQFDEIGIETYRGHRHKSISSKKSPNPSPPKRMHSPPPKHKITRPASPPPPAAVAARRLFGQSPRRLRSPPPGIKLRSPPGTRRTSIVATPQERTPVGITITRLAQRPNTTRTASLPHTPNPYFRDYRNKRREGQLVTSITPTPGDHYESHDRHIRGAVDIVIGLEKKRQKRKEKFWRQHCRKFAKEQAERKPIPGRGAERMKELGLVCAERNRGYGVGQQAPLVLSL